MADIPITEPSAELRARLKEAIDRTVDADWQDISVVLEEAREEAGVSYVLVHRNGRWYLGDVDGQYVSNVSVAVIALGDG